MSDTRLSTAAVPLADLVGLARLVQKMRRAQRDYYRLRKEQPHVDHSAAFRAARAAEDACDSAAAGALARERRTIPGMEAELPPRLTRAEVLYLRAKFARVELTPAVRDKLEFLIRFAEEGGATC